MSWPDPRPGLVIRYSYLWRREADAGREEGVKDRPCAIVLAIETTAGETTVYALPITHTPPSDPADAVECRATIAFKNSRHQVVVFGRGQTQEVDVMRLMAGAMSDVGQSWVQALVDQESQDVLEPDAGGAFKGSAGRRRRVVDFNVKPKSIRRLGRPRRGCAAAQSRARPSLR